MVWRVCKLPSIIIIIWIIVIEIWKFIYIPLIIICVKWIENLMICWFMLCIESPSIMYSTWPSSYLLVDWNGFNTKSIIKFYKNRQKNNVYKGFWNSLWKPDFIILFDIKILFIGIFNFSLIFVLTRYFAVNCSFYSLFGFCKCGE